MHFNVLIGIIFYLTFSNIFTQTCKIWETGEIYKAPESVAYDSEREFLYISNYTSPLRNGKKYSASFVSKANLNGEIIKLDWIKNLSTPTGICIFNDKLFIVERFGVVEYDLKGDSVSNKYYIKTPNFINDITIGKDGSIYVSESDTDIIYRIKNSSVEKWLSDKRILETNGILFDEDKLIVGVNSDSTIKTVNINTKEISKIAQLKKGIIDGIKKCADGYLVSHFEGNLYLIKKDGSIKELINTRNEKMHIADFEYIEEKELIIIPALWNNKLISYSYKP